MPEDWRVNHLSKYATALVKAAKAAYPKAGPRTVALVCGTLVEMALEDAAKPVRGDLGPLTVNEDAFKDY
jgi:hypothetical protein